MNRKNTFIIAVVVLAVLIVGAGFAYNYLGDMVDTNNLAGKEQSSQNDDSRSDGSSQQETTLAPDFAVTDLEGNKIKLSDFRGRPTVLNFWASWCGPCKMEMPDFEKAYNAYKDNINFVMVNLTDGSRETVDSAYGYITDSGYTFPVYYDTMLEAAIGYGVNSVPRTYFINSDGTMAAYAQSMLDEATLQKGIDMIYSQN